MAGRLSRDPQCPRDGYDVRLIPDSSTDQAATRERPPGRTPYGDEVARLTSKPLG